MALTHDFHWTACKITRIPDYMMIEFSLVCMWDVEMFPHHTMQTYAIISVRISTYGDKKALEHLYARKIIEALFWQVLICCSIPRGQFLPGDTLVFDDVGFFYHHNSP